MKFRLALIDIPSLNKDIIIIIMPDFEILGKIRCCFS